MSKTIRVAIAGATGVVGTEMLSVLESSKLPISEVVLLASKDSVGEIYKFRDQECEVQELCADSFKGTSIALFATSAELSAKYVPVAIESGAWAIDNSSHFRMDPAVPLVVPEVNASQISTKQRLIANPNCSTIQLVPVLKVIHEVAGLKRVVVSSYQSVSGAGKVAMDELWNQTLSIFNQRELQFEAFRHQIAFNCIPQIDVVMDNGYTKEEFKVINESRKILGLPDLRITATAVRVPVFVGHAESVNVETERELSPDSFCDLLNKCEWAEAYPDSAEYPMQLDVAQTDTIHVGRVRSDESVPHGLNMWIVADNVRKGAALNAVQIAEFIFNNHLKS